MIEGFSVPAALSLFGFGFILTLLISFATSVVVLLSGITNPRNFVAQWMGLFLYAVPLMSLGVIIGYLSTLSREPTLSDTLPAVLALAGGITVYIYSLESVRKSMVAGVSIFVFVANLVCGSAYGSYIRETGKLNRILYAIEQERQIRNFRISRKLPEEIPAWVLD